MASRVPRADSLCAPTSAYARSKFQGASRLEFRNTGLFANFLPAPFRHQSRQIAQGIPRSHVMALP